MPTPKTLPDLDELARRLMAHLDVRGPDDCWEWQGYRLAFGHGRIRFGYTGYILTHRLAWEVYRGPIPNGQVIRHTCDNPPCCNPRHLRLGSIADNNQDMRERGRQVNLCGEQHPMARLTASQVREIRSRAGAASHRSLAREYGVSRPTISAIIARRLWSTLD